VGKGSGQATLGPKKGKKKKRRADKLHRPRSDQKNGLRSELGRKETGPEGGETSSRAKPPGVNEAWVTPNPLVENVDRKRMAKSSPSQGAFLSSLEEGRESIDLRRKTRDVRD